MFFHISLCLLFVNIWAENDTELDLADRLGLLGPSLGLHPTGGLLDENNKSMDAADGDVQDKSEALVAISDPFSSSQCCCFNKNETCPDPFGSHGDLVSAGIVTTSSTTSPPTTSMNPTQGLVFSSRILPLELVSETDCPENMKSCCYDQDIDLDTFNVMCKPPDDPLALDQQITDDQWVQLCDVEKMEPDNCGLRSFTQIQHETSPGEFPWSCLLLTEENGFVGNCVLIPGTDQQQPRNGDEKGGCMKVLTAAHKLNKITDASRLKVRFGEYDASGFKFPETKNFTEKTVSKIVKHPQFSSRRLSHDVAVLILDGPTSSPDTAPTCLPTCPSQFGHVFRNSSGTHCWVSGWSVDRETHVFRPIINKQQVSLVPDDTCQTELQSELSSRVPGLGDTFVLSDSEICAREEPEDTCSDIDGGASLVCQSSSGLWTLAGVYTWSLGCSSPRVFFDVGQLRPWLEKVQ